MKKTINESDFVRAFDEYNRADNFTVEARIALYEYLTDYEAETGEELELDPIVVCVEYAEYDSVIEAAEQYFTYESKPEGTLEENMEAATEYLGEHTTVIPVEGTERVVIAQF